MILVILPTLFLVAQFEGAGKITQKIGGLVYAVWDLGFRVDVSFKEVASRNGPSGCFFQLGSLSCMTRPRPGPKQNLGGLGFRV